MRSLFGLVLSICLSGTIMETVVDAATTGKFSGVVTDAANGVPLPGVNVTLEGTRQGAVTQKDGRYVILAVDPGVYAIRATMVGFGSEKRQNVQVVADYTATVNFSLKESALDMDELVVIAKRPPVEPDKTTSKYVLTSADIETVPQVRAVGDLLALQPGMTLNGDNRIRGSYRSARTGTMVGYYIDGVEVSRNQLVNVNTTAIQEVSVLTGGMNAEFGGAGAGVVNLVAKEGRGFMQGRAEYKFTPAGKKHWGNDVYESPLLKDNVRWNDPAWVNETYVDPGPDRVLNTADDMERLAHERISYTNKRGHWVEGSVSGPIASNMSYFTSLTYARDPNIFPSAEQVVDDPPRVQATLTYRPTSRLKVKALGMYQRSNRYEGASRNNNRNIFYPEDFSSSGTFTLSRRLAVLTFTHTLNSNTYYDLKFSYSASHQDTAHVPLATENTRRDAQGYFNLPTLRRLYTEEEDVNYGMKFDFVRQVNSAHLIQTGFVFNQQGYHYTTENFPNARSRTMHFVADGFDLGKNVKPWKLNLYVQDKIEYGGLIANLGLRWDYLNFGRKASMGQALGRSPMYNTFTRAKYELDHLDETTPSVTALGPRVGLSHPITEKLAAHYFIGRSYTFPEARWTHRRSFQSDSPDQDLNNNGVIDPAEVWNTLEVNATSWQPSDGLKPQRSTSMEMGVDWNFVSDYTTSITAHYRRDEGLYGNNNISYWIDPLSGQSIQVNALRNTFWQTARGIELSLKKSFANHFQFALAYNAEWSRDPGGVHYGKYSANWYVMPDADFIANGHYWTDWQVDPATGAEVPVPLTSAEVADIGAKAEANIKAWTDKAGTPGPGVGPWIAPIQTNDDGIWTAAAGQVFSGEPTAHQRQGQLSLQVYYATPNQYGFQLGKVYPFGGLRASLVYRLIGGRPFEFFPPEGQSEFRTERPRMKSDLYVAKDFGRLGKLQATVFVDVKNVFNEKSSTVRNTDFTYVQYGLQLPVPDDTDYLLYGDPNETSRYQYEPREIEIGLTLQF